MRKFPRVPLRAEARYQLGDEPLVRPTINVSRGGVFIDTPSPPGQGTGVDLELVLPEGGGVVHAHGRVAWVRREPSREGPAGMGIEFLHMPDESRKALDRYIAATQLTQRGY